MSACDECRDDFDAMSSLVESLPDDMKTSNCVLNAEMLLVALAYQKAEKENAKLRELVRELWAQAEQNLVCDENCPYGATCNWMDSDVVCVFKRRMRELGVEVD